MIKVTQWFPCTTPPARAGEYEYRRKDCKMVPIRTYFTGLCFSSLTCTISDKIYWPNLYADKHEWRGLAEKPGGNSK